MIKYGFDLYGKERLLEFLEEFVKIDGFKWIRVMYLYLEFIIEELI